MSFQRSFRVLLVALLLGLTVLAFSSTAGEGPTPVAGSPSSAPPKATASENPSGSKSIITVTEGHLSVQVQNRSLKAILAEVSRKSGVPIIVGEGIKDQRVSPHFLDLPLGQGLLVLLQELDSFFFYGVQEQSPASLRAVWVYPKGQGRRIVPVGPEVWASTDEMRQRLRDPDPTERAQAVEVLMERQGKRAFDASLQALEDDDEKVRYRALYQAQKSGVALPSDVLLQLVQSDRSPVVRFLALDTIANAPGADPEHVREIAESALNDPHEAVREHASEILETLAIVLQPEATHESSPEQCGAGCR
jgi:HEAT repeats